MKKTKTTTAKAPRGKGAAKAAKSASGRKRQTGVRGLILDLLAAGPKTGSELVAQGGFSVASLYLNLKSLKDDGLIESERVGREVSIRLAGGAAPVEASDEGVSAPIEGEIINREEVVVQKTTAVSAAYRGGDLRSALDQLSARLSPVEGAREKLMVLDQLTRTMPQPIADVLRSLMDDVVRLSTVEG